MDDPRTPVLNASNLPEFTVSEISGAIKRTLEGEFGRVRVRGEITEMKRYPSGHIYFSLKDEGAKLSGIVWKNSVSRLGLVPENGVEVIATGRISALTGLLRRAMLALTSRAASGFTPSASNSGAVSIRAAGARPGSAGGANEAAGLGAGCAKGFLGEMNLGSRFSVRTR